jgi:hypothetical protein
MSWLDIAQSDPDSKARLHIGQTVRQPGAVIGNLYKNLADGGRLN